MASEPDGCRFVFISTDGSREYFDTYDEWRDRVAQHFLRENMARRYQHDRPPMVGWVVCAALVSMIVVMLVVGWGRLHAEPTDLPMPPPTHEWEHADPDMPKVDDDTAHCHTRYCHNHVGDYDDRTWV